MDLQVPPSPKHGRHDDMAYTKSLAGADLPGNPSPGEIA